MMQADIPPSQTIYIKNLHERIKKTELKKSLYALFSQYGRILDIVACRTEKLRGQAWVVFDDVTSATYALRNMKDFPFYDRPMKIQYAKTKSDVMSKLDGTFVPKEKRKKMEEKSEKKKREQNETTSSASPIPQPTQQNGFQAQPVKPSRQDHKAPPNNILFIQNLPHETTNDALHALFCQYPGFKEVRMVEAKPGIAFIEYGDEGQATTALEALQDFKITAKNAMEISYAKK